MKLDFEVYLDGNNYGCINIDATSIENLNKIFRLFKKTVEEISKNDQTGSLIQARKIHRYEIEIGPVKFDDGSFGKFIVLGGHLRTKTHLEDAKKHCEMNAGFRLPTKEELDLIIQHRHLIDSVDESASGKFSDISDDWIWSSTEYLSKYAWVRSHCYQGTNDKTNDCWVVPFKRINS